MLLNEGHLSAISREAVSLILAVCSNPDKDATQSRRVFPRIVVKRVILTIRTQPDAIDVCALRESHSRHLDMKTKRFLQADRYNKIVCRTARSDGYWIELGKMNNLNGEMNGEKLQRAARYTATFVGPWVSVLLGCAGKRKCHF